MLQVDNRLLDALDRRRASLLDGHAARCADGRISVHSGLSPRSIVLVLAMYPALVLGMSGIQRGVYGEVDSVFFSILFGLTPIMLIAWGAITRSTLTVGDDNIVIERRVGIVSCVDLPISDIDRVEVQPMVGFATALIFLGADRTVLGRVALGSRRVNQLVGHWLNERLRLGGG